MKKATILVALLALTMASALVAVHTTDNLSGLRVANNSIFDFNGSPRLPF